MKVIKFLKANKKWILKWSLVFILSAVAFVGLHKLATVERGYNAINQLAGYLISSDPAYISSHNNARSIIQSVERHEIIEELVRFYLEGQK